MSDVCNRLLVNILLLNYSSPTKTNLRHYIDDNRNRFSGIEEECGNILAFYILRTKLFGTCRPYCISCLFPGFPDDEKVVMETPAKLIFECKQRVTTRSDFTNHIIVLSVLLIGFSAHLRRTYERVLEKTVAFQNNTII